MSLWPKKAIGVDISEGYINLALLRQVGKTLELVKTARGQLPKGTVVEGNVERPLVLAKAVKDLLRKKRMFASRVAVSLPANPVLLQIMQMPKQMPKNITRFVEEEVKNYVVLPGKQVAYDFCNVGSKGPDGRKRLLVAAAEKRRVGDFATALTRKGLNIKAIEPKLIGGVRAVFADAIAGKFNSNVLLAMVETGVLTFCVFRNQALDFVRTINIDAEQNEPGRFCERLATEIDAIIRFYDIEVPDSHNAWEATFLAADSVQLPAEVEQSVKEQISSLKSLQVITGQNLLGQISQSAFKHAKQTTASPVAIGLAMSLLQTRKNDLEINLLPREVADSQSLRHDVLITANIAAALLLAGILTVAWFSVLTEKAGSKMVTNKSAQSSWETRVLLNRDERTAEQTRQISEKVKQLNAVLDSRLGLNWFGILNDLRASTPVAVRITKLNTSGGRNLMLEGVALSYEAVYVFIDMLNKSKNITNASLIETKKKRRTDGLVKYAISCSLAVVKEKR